MAPERFEKWGDWEPDLIVLGPTQGPGSGKVAEEGGCKTDFLKSGWCMARRPPDSGTPSKKHVKVTKIVKARSTSLRMPGRRFVTFGSDLSQCLSKFQGGGILNFMNLIY